MVKKNTKEHPTKDYAKKMEQALSGKILHPDGKERFERTIEKELKISKKK